MPDDASRSRRRRVNGEASQQRILDAATEIAAERGYEGTSIGLVSERSGLPASSIYWHFKDKDALLAAVIDHSFHTWLANAGGGGIDQADAAEHGGASTDEQLTLMMRRTRDALRGSSDFLRLGLMLTLERRETEPTARRRFLTVRDEAFARTVANFARLFPDLDDAALRTLGTFAMATADGLFIATEIDGDDPATIAAFDVLAATLQAAAHHLRTATARPRKRAPAKGAGRPRSR